MPYVFTDAMGVHDFALIDSTDWATETAALPNTDNAQSPTTAFMEDTFFIPSLSELDMRSGSWTVEFWVYLEAGLSATGVIIACGVPGDTHGTRWQVSIGATETISWGLYNTLGNPSIGRVSSSALSVTTWYYVVCDITNLSNLCNIYFNGSAVNGTLTTGGTTVAPAGGDKVFLGTDTANGSQLPSTVRIAKLAIYDRLLSSGEMALHELTMTT